MVQLILMAPMTIRWKLHHIMFDRDIKNGELAAATGFHVNTISKLKNLREMPDRLEKNTLNGLCRALNCQPSDLMEYAPDTPAEAIENDQTDLKDRNKGEIQ